jgi:hypothetical protein
MMTNRQEWTRRELETIFNKNATHLESIAREMSGSLRSVDVVLDQDTQRPVINFAFGEGTEPDLDMLPPQIGGVKVTHRFIR